MRSKSLAILLSIVLASGVLLAQATHVTTSGTLPTNCRVGDVYNKTGTSAGLYRCSATNTWTAVGSSGTGDVVGPSSATADRIAVFDGTTGKLLKDGGQTIAGIVAGSGSGNITSTGAEGSQPGTPNSGDLYLPDNGFYLRRYSGSAWVPWGPIFPLTDPALAAPTTWVNQGGASVDTTYGGIYLTAPAGAGDNIRARVKTAPATPYVVTAAFLMNVMAVNYPNAGLLFRDSVSGKIVTFAFGAEVAKYTLAVTKYNSASSYNASYVAPNWWPATVVWLRIADNGTNRICSYSSDGQHWQVLHTVGRTDFLTADQVGFYANANNATYPADLTLLSWKET